MKFIAFFAAVVLGPTQFAFAGPTTEPADDVPAYGASLYQAAARMITDDSPSGQDFPAPSYPPDSAEWRNAAAATYDAGGAVRDVVQKARLVSDTQWPEDPSYLLGCRKVANNLGDAALFLDWQRKHAQAVELVRDIFHLSDLLEEKRPSNKFLVRVLVGVGTRAIAADRLQQIVSGSPLTGDPGNDHDLQVTTAPVNCTVVGDS